MTTAIDRLQQLQVELDRRFQAEWADECWKAEVTVSEADGLIAVNYHGSHDGDAIERLFETLCMAEVAVALGSIAFAGDDDGANGTKDWDFSGLLELEVMFPKLHTLSIELYVGQHNRPIVARDGYDEDGELAQWLDRGPRSPVAHHPLGAGRSILPAAGPTANMLRVQAGYATQRFISGLAQSSCFPRLEELDWTEIEAIDHDAEMKYANSLLPGYAPDAESEAKLEQANEEAKEDGAPTSFEEFEALLRSAACPAKVTLRDPILTSEQVAALEAGFRSRHPDGSLSIISPHTDPYWSSINRKHWGW